LRGLRVNIAVLCLVAMATVILPVTLFHIEPSFAAGKPDAAIIRVGILYSQTGTMAVSEKPVANATLLAIEQINAHGGLLGRRLEAVMADGKSDEATFVSEAARLIDEEHVDVLFGCWTSASRKAVKPIVEGMDSLLFYPVQYEGLEQSDHIVYTGAVPNQQIVPAVNWAINNLGKRVYLVGSDYVFPHVANWLINKQLKIMQASQVGEAYVRLGSTAFASIIADIRLKHPDVIINTINGDSNIAFFHALKQAGITDEKTPVLSFSLAEAGMKSIPVDEIAGQFAAWSYFQSLDSAENRTFVRAFHHRFGHLPISDPMESAWVGVQIWAAAVKSAGTSDPRVIRDAILHQSLDAPEGTIAVDRASRHLWKTARIGRVNRQRQFDVVWSSKRALKPFPYPLFVNRDDARALLNKLYRGWGGQWSAPARDGDHE